MYTIIANEDLMSTIKKLAAKYPKLSEVLEKLYAASDLSFKTDGAIDSIYPFDTLPCAYCFNNDVSDEAIMGVVNFRDEVKEFLKELNDFLGED